MIFFKLDIRTLDVKSDLFNICYINVIKWHASFKNFDESLNILLVLQS